MERRHYDIYCGIDVGKSVHHAIALTADGRRVLSRDLPQDEAMLRALFRELAEHGSVLMVVDQPRNIGALSIAVARDSGIDVAYLPGLRMRRIASLYPGQAKTDARDAFIIADAARTLPDTLLPVTQDDDIVEGLRMLAGSTETWRPRRTASRAVSDRYCSRCTPPSNGPSESTCTGRLP